MSERQRASYERSCYALLVRVGFTAARLDESPGAGDFQADSGRRSLVELAQRLRAKVRQEPYDEARAMMSERWFTRRNGEGWPWRVSTGTGPWSAWDEHFRSEGEVAEWRVGEGAAIAVVQETNDYFKLLERGTMTNEITHFFDDRDRLDGLLINVAGERPPGRTDEFLACARQHEPEEFRALMPGGEIDPSGDHRALLDRWRSTAGLEQIPPGLDAEPQSPGQVP